MSTGPYDVLRRRAAERIGALELDPRRDREGIRFEVDRLVSGYQRRAHAGDGVKPFRDPTQVSNRLMDSLVGYGPLTPILDRRDVEEVFIEGDRITFIDLSGRLQVLDVPTSEEENRQIVARILAGTNRRLDTSNPIEQARVLSGRARLTAVIPPIADRLSATIRKYTVKNHDLEFLVDKDVVSKPVSVFLGAAARATTTILFSGPPGAGKTTLLSAFLRAVPVDRCVRICEEVREIDVPLIHGSFYEASPPTLEGKRRYTLRDLVKVVLAQRPDLICVGEVRGAEAFELIRAVNAGCSFACTIHANSAGSAVGALVNAALMAGENVTERVVNRVFRSAIDFVVHLQRDQPGDQGGAIRRQVMEIVAVGGVDRDQGYEPESLFLRDGPGAPLRWTGGLPSHETVLRIQTSLPDGVTLESIFSGDWRPQP